MTDQDDYEQARLQRIKENNIMLAELGLLDFSIKPKSKSAPRLLSRNNSANSPPRRSERGQSKPPPSYTEDDFDNQLYTPSRWKPRPKLWWDHSCRSSAQKKRNNTRVFTRGNRVYDGINGESCHQCRQKTTDPKVYCTNVIDGHQCPLMWDRQCYWSRYGVDADEIDESIWHCPRCSYTCNCSFCRDRPGFNPTLPPGLHHFGRRSPSQRLTLQRVITDGSDQSSTDEDRFHFYRSQDTANRRASTRLREQKDRDTSRFWEMAMSQEIPDHEVYVMVPQLSQSP
ncbi:hypothetical protein H4R35_005166 [Dimargaris xerosporica]|nr:hypothetical protein H4R35_005166 [Dimargaris xerosporica]